jgi:branched-chain amino acid transport system substrate-binding protein
VLWPRKVAALSVVIATLSACVSSKSSSHQHATDGGSGQVNRSYAGQTIPIGAVLSLTGLGAVYGPSQQKGIQLAVDEINAAGGVSGASLQLTVSDDASDQAQAARKTQQLIDGSKALGLLGPTLSNSAVTAHPVAASGHTPMLAVSTTGFDIVGKGCTYCNGWIYRDSLGEASAIPANLRAYADKAHPKTGVLLYPTDDKFSADGAKVVQDTVASVGIRLLQTVPFTKSATDLTPFVTTAVNQHPDVIFITSLGQIPAQVIDEARREGFTGQFLGGNGFNTENVSRQAGAPGMGAQSASAWYLENTFSSNAGFVADYRARYGSDPDQFAAQAYAGVQILADSARRANLTFTDTNGDRSRLKKALADTNIDTPLGPFRFTADHDVVQTIWIVAMNGQGGFNLVTSVKPG